MSRKTRLDSDSVIIDYLRFTVPISYKELDTFISSKGTPTLRVKLNESPFELMLDVVKSMHFNGDGLTFNDGYNYGLYSYDRTYSINDIKYLICDVINDDSIDDSLITIKRTSQMGVCVDMSGFACRRYETFLNYLGLTFKDVLTELVDKYPDIKFTRIDLARDVRNRVTGVTPLAFYNYCRSSERIVKSSSNKWRYYASGDLRFGSEGDTLTMGLRSSDFYLRIYDKAKERRYRHGDNIGANVFWIRWEFEIKHLLASEIVMRLVNASSMMSLYDIYLDLLVTKIKVLPTSKERLKGHYKTVIEHRGGRKYKHEYAIWYYLFSKPINRNRVVVSRPIKVKSGYELVENHSTGSFFEKLYIHVSRGGNPFKLLAHWIQQGKLKKNDDNFFALLNTLKHVKYDPKSIDDTITTIDAFKTIKDLSNYEVQNYNE